MGRKFHDFRRRHSGHNNNALSSITESTEGNINKIVCMAIFTLYFPLILKKKEIINSGEKVKNVKNLKTD